MTPDTFYEFRQRLGLTQARAADALGISRSMWIKLETGQKPCTRPRFYGLAMTALMLGLLPFQELPRDDP